MKTVQDGARVTLHYTGRLRDGSVFDSSRGRAPFDFVVGSGQVIPGFDRGVRGMTPGETRTVEIPAAEAYGVHRAEMVLNLDRAQFPADVAPEIGQELRLGLQDGGTIDVRVTEVTDDLVTLDANHPLAGEDLIFDLELLDVK